MAANPDSAKAHLSLGVIRLFQYQNGVGLQPDQIDWPGDKPKTRAEYQARAERRRAQIEEQNATNAANAEQHLKKSLELEPRYELAIEYLGGLYYWWLDPTTEQRVRLDDAKQCYERVLEINPQHRFAEYACGAIDWDWFGRTLVSHLRLQITRAAECYAKLVLRWPRALVTSCARLNWTRTTQMR